MPKAEAWVWNGDEQSVKQAKAYAMVGSRLCVFGRARQVYEDQLRGVAQDYAATRRADVRGFITTFEPPQPDTADQG
jgi:hypothetical protein